jgi:hypothetical protein
MNVKKYCLLLLLVLSNTVIAQQTINNFKYIIVPRNYDFLKQEDQYQVNSLTKFLFEKEEFQTFFDNENKPTDLQSDWCLGLTCKVKDYSSTFSTTLVIELVNCNNEVIFKSKKGTSKLKDYRKGFHQALRNAFESIQSLQYHYVPEKLKTNSKEEVQNQNVPQIKLHEAIEPKPEKPVIVKLKNNQELTATSPRDNNDFKNENTYLLYAQPNALGFQLVDNTPKVIFILLNSSKKDFYIIKNANGFLYKNNNIWMAEYYEGEQLIKKELKIKF